MSHLRRNGGSGWSNWRRGLVTTLKSISQRPALSKRKTRRRYCKSAGRSSQARLILWRKSLGGIGWSSIVSSVALKATDEVEINLRTTFVLPEALLTIPLDQPGGAGERGNQPYTMLKREGDVTRYALSDSYQFLQKTQPAEIVER